MKRILVGLLVLCFIALIGVYVFIAGKIDFNEVIVIKINQAAAGRLFTDESMWEKWWPIENKKAGALAVPPFLYKNYQYYVAWKTTMGDSIIIKNNSDEVNSFLNIIPLSNDSVAVQWKGQSANTLYPLKRIKNYFASKRIENNAAELLQSMKFFLEKKENVYGLEIKQIQVKDTILLGTKYSSDTYPTTAEIYNLIKSLRDHISKNAAIETNYPMLHITQDSGRFKTMVAIPVNKIIPANDKFLYMRMIPGKILLAEVNGGRFTTDAALGQLEIYIDDNHLRSPAIPFESLVTDRSKEADTTKWVTKIYYPIY